MPTLSIDIEGRLASFQDALNRVERQATGVSQRLESAFGGFKSIVTSLAPALAGIGIASFVKSSLDGADALQQLSNRTGIAVEQLSALQYAAKLSDVSAEGLETSLRQLAKNMLAGGDAFKTLGVNVRTSSGVLRSTDDVLLDLADAFQKLPDGATKAGLAVQLLGKNGTELIPLLNGGRQGIAEFTREAERLGVIVSGTTARAADELNDNLDRLRASVQGIGVSISSQLAGPLADITTRFLQASQAAGSFGEAMVRMALGQGSNIEAELRETEQAIERVRKRREELAKQPVTRFSSKGTQMEILQDEENELRVREDYLKRLQEIQRATAVASKPTALKDIAIPEKGAGKAGISQELANAREIDRIVTDARAKFAASQFALTRDAQEREDQATLAQARATQQELEGILSLTTDSRIAKIQKSQEVLRQALADGKVGTDQFSEAMALLDQQAADTLFSAGDNLKAFSKDASESIRELQVSIEGFGRRASDTFAELVVTGKANFSDLVQSILKDIVSLMAYQMIMKPLVGGITGMFTGGLGGMIPIGLAKGGVIDRGELVPFARGGVVTRPTVFPFADGVGLMGEAGPEAIMPLRRGPGGRLGVEAAGGGGGNVQIHQTMSFNSGADPATMAGWAQTIKQDTIATLQVMKSRGQF
jgi:lambda family phage tail tape measure protein